MTREQATTIVNAIADMVANGVSNPRKEAIVTAMAGPVPLRPAVPAVISGPAKRLPDGTWVAE